MTIAALLGGLTAFVVGAALDWIWQLPLVAGFGLVCLALLLGAATLAAPAPSPPERRRRPGFGPAAAFVLVVWALAGAQLVPWLTQRELDRSRDAAGRGDTSAALEHAETAREIQPWAATPRLQAALVHELAGDFPRARRAAREAARHDERDWRTWVVLARVAVKDGRISEGRTALRRARQLNPRSPLLQGRSG